MSPKALFGWLKEAALDWLKDKTPHLAAALAFYTVLSVILPLLTLMVTVVGLVFGQEAAQGGDCRAN
ncbi:MAG: hypothetical protein BRC47_09410 [Cyanobacteria bacterium QS_7_48_42]|nr:MAG: hypothetical protein BRC34_11765 [Cyanobacteria bacterium QH_1_48_107]PSO77528.1 MAG: hypothetical protein BRC37_02145 [Cyanobacteria bacterium QH_3_48_40]PSP01513.1 MAG: hypothetical protein BRC47_09410 [Cyanobacteria bacterium QS_7_48_42]PSP04855.1 MAG: hypothetical protein BRC51_06610 [Cyanobacteria bacterium SW_12_48_29]